MGKSRKRYDNRVKGKSNHLQYACAKNSENASSTSASKSDTSINNSNDLDTKEEGVNQLKSSAPEECGSNELLASLPLTMVDETELSNKVESALQYEDTEISEANSVARNNSLPHSFVTERGSSDGFVGTGDTSKDNEQNTNFDQTLDDTAEKTSGIGKQITSKINTDSQSSTGFSDLMKQFQRHAVKKVSDEQDLAGEIKFSSIRRMSSSLSTDLKNYRSDSSFSEVSLQTTASNSSLIKDDLPIDLSNKISNSFPKDPSQSTSSHSSFTREDSSFNLNNNLNITEMRGNTKFQCGDKHQNSISEVENSLATKANILLTEGKQFNVNEVVDKHKISENQQSPYLTVSSLHTVPKDLPYNLQSSRANHAKFANRGVQTNEIQLNSGCSNSRELAYQNKKTGEVKQLNFQKIFSNDKKEFIKKENKINTTQYSGKIRINILDSDYHITFGCFGSENLIVIDSQNYEKFIGSIRIETKEDLNFMKSFESNKLILFKRMTITKILTDELLNKRNKLYDDFIHTLEKRSQDISNNLSCTEDFLQFLLIGRSQNLSLDKPLILLKNIIQNENISDEVKRDAKRLEQVENLLYSRNQFFPAFSQTANPEISDLFAALRQTCQDGITNHKRNLMNKCPNKSFHLVCLVVTINRLPSRNLLFINNKDIELFSDIMELANDKDHSGGKVFPVNFVEYLWNNFFKRVQAEKSRSLKQLGPMTHPIYYFLLKTLRDVIADISKKQINAQELIISSREGELIMTDSINWSSDNPVNRSLEEQFRLIFRLMKHFEPGAYSFHNKFIYNFKLLKENENMSIWQMLKNKFFGNVNDFKNVSQERVVWLYIVDCGVAPILGDKSKSRFKQLSLSVLAGFVKFIQEAKHEKYESFRVAALNIIKFTVQISPYFSTINCVLTDTDHDILNKQIGIISNLLCSEDNEMMSAHFSDLMMIYNEYWEHRESIVGKLPIPCSIFKPDVEMVMQKLVQIVQKALLKDFNPQLTMKFLRLYNEFLKHLKSIDFTWFISKNAFFPELSSVVEKVTKNDITSYKVIEPEDFIEILKKKPKRYPKHFSLEVVKKLLDVVSNVFDKNDWVDEDCVKAAGDLFLAVGHSFTHFEDQTDYTDLEHFLRDCTVPFCCVVENSSSYSDFKQRLENVENFYLYARKQNQIGIEQALDICEREVSLARTNGFKTEINRAVIEKCYNLYSKELVSLENFEIPDILDKLEKLLENIQEKPLKEWTSDFKQNVLPVLLADLSAVWSLQESKDVAGIKKRIEPHCVQILCILRLLGVDHDSVGVPKHLTQVLTGQGKSLILGLLSAIIGLTGNSSFIVCYSNYLAKRDQKAFASFYKVFDRFNLINKIGYNTFDDMANETLVRKINGIEISLRSVVSDLILNKLQKHSTDTAKFLKSTVLLIDEADVFFSEKFYDKTFNPLICVSIPAFLEIQPKLWNILEDGVSEKHTILRKIKEFINELLKDEQYEDFRRFLKATSRLFEQNLDRMVNDALLVSKSSSDNDTYKIDKYGIIITKNSGGVYCSSICRGYLNTFYYFKLKKDNFDDKFYKNFGYMLVNIGSISYASLPSRYENILGVSGTLMTLNNSEINAIRNYGIETISAMPSFFGERKLVFEPSKNVSILDMEDNWLADIFDKVSNCIRAKRAVLVFFETDVELKLFADKYRTSINRLHILTGNEEPDVLEWRINEAGVAQTVTLATRAMGRGVDYKSNDRSVEENGGVHVIQTFFSLDEKEETQIKGRTARKDNKGSYELVLCREHLEILECADSEAGKPINSYVELCNSRKRIAKAMNAIVEENIRNSEKEHNLTMEFFESLAKYSPEKRHEYLSKFPFVTDE